MGTVFDVQKEYRKEYGEYLQELKTREKQGRKPISFDDYLWEASELRVKKNRRESNG